MCDISWETSSRREDNTVRDLKEKRYLGLVVGLVWLRIWTSGRLS
jgi:hypothetical protein